MKTTFFTLGSILFAILIISYFFKSCEEQQKDSKIKEQHQIKLLTNSKITDIKDQKLPRFIQKLTGVSRYRTTLTVYDSLNVEEVNQYIDVNEPCFDTLKVGQSVDYLKFYQQAKFGVKSDIGNGYILQIFTILVSIGVLFYGLSKIIEKFSVGR